MKENSINDCNSLKLIISVKGGHCEYSFREPQNLAKPPNRSQRYGS